MAAMGGGGGPGGMGGMGGMPGMGAGRTPEEHKQEVEALKAVRGCVLLPYVCKVL